MNYFTFVSGRGSTCLALICVTFFCSLTARSQKGLHYIHATSKNVTIRDGYIKREGIWELDPAVRPDVYHPLAPDVPVRIAFYTDKDTLTLKALPGEVYDFGIILNQRDTCFTRVQMARGVTAKDDSGMEKVASELLAMDYAVFMEALKRHHPGLFRYRTEAEMEQQMNKVWPTLNRPMSSLEFGREIVRIVSFIADGHTGTNLPSLLMKSWMEQKKLIPLILYFRGEQAFVSCASGRLSAGDEILSIRGIEMQKIRKELMKYLPSDGMIETKKNQVLSNGAFPFLYGWVFGHAESFEVTFRNEQGMVQEARIDAAFVRDFMCEVPRGFKVKEMAGLTYPSEDIGLLTLRTFDKGRLRNAGVDFISFIEKTFAELKERKVKKLVIDLRDNTGGNDEHGAILYAHLALKPFRYFRSVKTADGNSQDHGNSLLEWIQPVSAGFKGEVCILINGQTFSTAADFCAVAKSEERARFAGEETGGAYEGNNSGQTLRVELPNTGIQVIIPRFRYENAVKPSGLKGRGIMPDETINTGVIDLINNRDVVLEAVLQK